ncbi:MAG TPA: AraC family transcriptional regulator [Spirochaetota bacterium]|nr:AraC family transcriptional regulator [Spirochaetota bacterium]
MSELSIIGKNFYPGYELRISCRCNENFTGDNAMGSRYRLVLIHEGTGTIDTGTSRLYFIAPSCVCLNEKEKLIISSENPVNTSVLYFHPAVLNNFFEYEAIDLESDGFPLTAKQDLYLLRSFRERNDRYKGQIQIGHNSLKRIMNIFNAIDRETDAQDTDSWPCRSRSFLIEILFLVSKIMTENPVPDHAMMETSDDDIERAIRYLHHNYQNDITVSDLVRVCDVNRTTLAERFSHETGFTIKTYLNRLRVNIAMTMIHDTDLPIQEIAYRTGFNDITNFGRVFRKFTSQSPSEYRDQSRVH